jgi:hypothetical protein
MAFKGTNFCSVKCQKIAGKDVSSVGTIMFVTSEEKEMITRGRE